MFNPDLKCYLCNVKFNLDNADFKLEFILPLEENGINHYTNQVYVHEKCYKQRVINNLNTERIIRNISKNAPHLLQELNHFDSAMVFNQSDLNWLKDLQKRTLKNTRFLVSLFHEIDVDYCVVGGTLLSIVRSQKGMLKLDYDVDIVIKEEGWKKIRTAFNNHKELPFIYHEEYLYGRLIAVRCYTEDFLIQRNPNSHQNGKIYPPAIDLVIYTDWKHPILKKMDNIITALMPYSSYKKTPRLDKKVVKFILEKSGIKWFLVNGIYKIWMSFLKNINLKGSYVGTSYGIRSVVFPKQFVFPGVIHSDWDFPLKVPLNTKGYLGIKFGKNYLTPKQNKIKLFRIFKND